MAQPIDLESRHITALPDSVTPLARGVVSWGHDLLHPYIHLLLQLFFATK